MAVTLVGGVDPDAKIWRYMTLDKFIHFLDSETLYFNSLSAFMKSDPFEGMPPVRIIKKIRQLVHISQELKNALADMESKAESVTAPNELAEIFDSLSEPLRSEHRDFRKLVTDLFKGYVVSCWHANEYESEAMWKLYGDSHRGVAIQTTVGKLQMALQSDEKLNIAKVIYSDYEKPTEEALRHLVVSGLAPLMKRLSYSHEAEVRAYFLPSMHKVGVGATEAKSYSVKVSGMSFIDGVVISPYAGEPYTSAVKSIAGKYGLNCSVGISQLLQGFDGLFDLGEYGGAYN
ncbi:DUF2971 domain-containing protein [Pseudomonas agarici]|uniref:DUF2971 domain-containing protein n=1 Tax=Pseudomonas agarici TaxID=46677 RepID=UPI0015A4D169|nr:DUF2971 domain-containing protein [Pseudomonas agarici]NWB91591.1 DUF2971 domain-containing protein [Pseudomonas agarici]